MFVEIFEESKILGNNLKFKKSYILTADIHTNKAVCKGKSGMNPSYRNLKLT